MRGATLARLVTLAGILAGCGKQPRRPKPVQRAEMVLIGKHSIIKQADFHQALQSAGWTLAALASRSAIAAPGPQDWPATIAWRPLRNFGPFFAGSDLSQVQVLVNGLNASWAYDGFFQGHPDQAIYAKYYATLPTNVPPALNPVPGVFPSTSFLNELLGLTRIRYSSRYGGSVELLFASVEDFQGEAGSGTLRWDIGSLEISVYVTPELGLFNPTGTNLFNGTAGSVHVELRPARISAYTANGTQITASADPGAAQLAALLGQLAAGLEVQPSGYQFLADAKRFAHAYVHTQFKDLIATNDFVDTVKISDDFLDLHTRQGQGMILVQTRIDDVNLNTEPGDEEIAVALDAQHMFGSAPSDNPVVSHAFDEINDHEGTGFATIGAFTFDECDRLQGIILEITVVENDLGDFDDHYAAIFQSLSQPDCSALRDLYNSGQLGVVSQLPTEDEALMQGGDVKGGLSHTTRVVLTRR